MILTKNQKIKKSKNQSIKSESGQMALFAIMLISFFTLLWATTMNLISIDKMELSFLKHKSEETFYISDACINHALGNLKYNAVYTGESLNIGAESCTITVETNVDERTINAESTIQGTTRTIEVVADLTAGNPNTLTITSWEEQ